MHAIEVGKGEDARRTSVDRLGRVLVVDDEDVIRFAIERLLSRAGYEVKVAAGPTEARALAARERFEVALLDLRMEGMNDGIELLGSLKSEDPDLEVVMMTAYGTPEVAFRAVKLGAFDWLTKPFDDIDKVAHVVAQALRQRRLIESNKSLQSKVAIADRFEDLVGRSSAMRQVFEIIESAAPTDASILIQGEPGTGKELVARAIHRRSARSGRPLVAVHAGAIPETLLESELFGHARGAFTGANAARKGHFEEADGGTIFFDEIGEMPLTAQVRLLRVLQEGEIVRVGESSPRRVDVRTIAATNRSLGKEKSEGRFREDLFYRLNVIPITLPPLRDRQDEIPILADHFLKKCGAKTKKRVELISSDAMTAMLAYRWPGNVREFENAIERAMVLCRGEVIELGQLPPEIQRLRTVPPPAGVLPAADIDRPFADAKNDAVSRFERDYVIAMLEATDGNISEAARRAGLDRSNFRRVMLKYKDEVEPLLPSG